MEPGTPSTWRPAFPAARPPGPLRILRIPAALTLLAIPLDVLAWLSGPVELFWTYVFWEALLWGGVVLYFAGVVFDGRVRGARA
jgi:hypothetical protein